MFAKCFGGRQSFAGKSADGDPNSTTMDEIMYYKDKLIHWVATGPFWSMTADLLPVIAHACPAGSIYAIAVWKFFQQMKWRHPDLPLNKEDYGITWYELAIQFTIFAGKRLPVWIHDSDKGFAVPFDFFFGSGRTPKTRVSRSWSSKLLLSEQSWDTLKILVEFTFFHVITKTGASSLFRLGFHRSLMGESPLVQPYRRMPCLMESWIHMPRLQDKITHSMFESHFSRSLTMHRLHLKLERNSPLKSGIICTNALKHVFVWSKISIRLCGHSKLDAFCAD